MADKIYLDTNIIIDLFDSSRPMAKYSLEIIKRVIREQKQLAINSDTITNAFYILSKQRKKSSSELIKTMKKLVQIFVIVPVEQKDILEAFTLCGDDKTAYKDYEDAVQYICAKKIEASLILTNDKGFVSENIVCMNSELYMTSLK